MFLFLFVVLPLILFLTGCTTTGEVVDRGAAAYDKAIEIELFG
ncbi:unnamed protein product, partial [marine sediment metagenome]